MAKILLVHFERKKTTKKTEYKYPPEYDSQKIDVTAYEAIGDEVGVIARGNTEEYCIGVVKDEDAPQFLESKDIVEITREEAIIKGRLWRPQINTIMDINVVNKILENKATGTTLTQKEEDALNPESSETGFNKSKLYDDVLDEAITSK